MFSVHLVDLFFCLSAGLLATSQIVMKLGGMMYLGPKKHPLNFGADSNHVSNTLIILHFCGMGESHTYVKLTLANTHLRASKEVNKTVSGKFNLSDLWLGKLEAQSIANTCDWLIPQTDYKPARWFLCDTSCTSHIQHQAIVIYLQSCPKYRIQLAPPPQIEREVVVNSEWRERAA